MAAKKRSAAKRKPSGSKKKPQSGNKPQSRSQQPGQRQTKRSRQKQTAAEAAVKRGISPLLLILLALVAFAFVFSSYLEIAAPEPPQSVVDSFIEKDADLAVHFIDVGQGDCALITWNGAAVLIDSGEKEYGKTVLDHIKSQGVKKLDYIIVTHPHSDHMGSMAEIISGIDAEKVIAPKVSEELIPTTKNYENFLDALRNRSLKLTAAKAGSVYTLSGRTALPAGKSPPKFEVLAPVKDYDDLNNYSAVIKLTYGNTSYLFTGDIEKSAEADIIESGADLSADVLKAAHHGSSSSNSEAFIDAVSPGICVIQAGAGNDYGHPHAQTLDNFERRRIKVYRTDMNGTVVVYSDGSEIFVRTEK